jgi:hypothetical protein
MVSDLEVGSGGEVRVVELHLGRVENDSLRPSCSSEEHDDDGERE